MAISKRLLIDTYNKAFETIDGANNGDIDKEIIYDFLDSLSEVELLELGMNANKGRLLSAFKSFTTK